MAFEPTSFSEPNPVPQGSAARVTGIRSNRQYAPPPQNTPPAESDEARRIRQTTFRKQSASPLASIAAGFTIVAFLVALSQIFFMGNQGFDWISPPFAIVGSILTLVAIVRGSRPRQLAMFALLWSGIYWIYILLVLLAT